MENNNTIIFRMGEETGIVIEKTKEQFEHSLFREQYKQVFSIMDTIIERSTKTEEHPMIDDKMSNIIVFCGDRGEGKTSALETVRGILSSKDILKAVQDTKLISSSKIDADSFKVLRLIDPAFFDDKHNLLELLIGQMYADIREAEKKNNDDDSYSNYFDGNLASRNHLIGMFQEVKKSLSIIHKASDKNAYDSLEEVDDLAAGIELKAKFDELMQEYAKFFHKKRVLISIDDLDLNATEGYTMSEEIRKYLSSPTTCVVLMAVKIEQMIEVVQSYLRQKISKEIIPNENISEMAYRYVMKLMPESHRILMPSGEEIAERPLKLAWEKDKKEYPPVKEVVVQYIYNKTGYIFINGRSISPIVPTNLRAVRHLIGMLSAMPNAKDKDHKDNLKNKEDFKAYFYTSWKNNMSDRSNLAFVDALSINEDVVSINKTVVNHLKGIIIPSNANKQDNIEITDTILKDILNPLNAMQNISLGDVFYVMNSVENISTSTENKLLIFFLRAYYSMKLYDMYNFISESEANLFPDATNGIAIYKYDTKLQKRNLVQRLVNGSYFTYKAGSLIPSDSRLSPRDKRVINGNELVQLFKNLKSTSTKELLLCEFFALTTTYAAYAWQGTDYDRKLTSRSYFDSFSESNQYIVFDALSIFYNIINIKQTYQRWNDIYNIGRSKERDFYNDCIKNKNSLLYAMLEICKKEHNWSPKTKLDDNLHYFISEAIVRISEVQLSILDKLINDRDKLKTGKNLYNLQSLYESIRKIGIKLYPNREGTNIYDMEFLFLKPIVDYLSKKEKITEEEFNKIFQVEVTNNTVIKTLQTAFGGTILGMNATSSFTGKEIREKLSQLEDADLFEELDWDAIFEDGENYSRKDVIAMLSQEPTYSKIRNISRSIKTREDAVQKAKEEAAKIADKNLKDIERQIKELIKPLSSNITSISQELKAVRKSQDEEKKNREAQIKQIEKHIATIEKEAGKTDKKKQGSSTKNETAVVAVETIEEPNTTEK